MKHSVQWYIPSHIISMEIEGDISLEDLANINHDLMCLLDEGNAPVYLFVNDTKVGKFPLQLRQVQSACEFLRHPSIEYVVGIGEVNPMKKYFIPMVAKITNSNYERCHTIENALAFVDTQDSNNDYIASDSSVSA